MGNSDSRAEFRGLVEAIFDVEEDESLSDGGDNSNISNTRILPKDHPLWDRFWSVETAERDIFEFIQPDLVRKMMQAPDGVLRTSNLLMQAVEQMEAGLEEDKISSRGYARILNAIRVTTRVLPFILESSQDPQIHTLFWVTTSSEVEGTEATAEAHAEVQSCCLAQRLLKCIGRLAFLPGFTLPGHFEKPLVPTPATSQSSAADRSLSNVAESKSSVKTSQQASEGDEEYETLLDGMQKHLIWCGGIGNPDGPNAVFRGLNKNRYEILKLLMVSQSEILYSSPAQCEPEMNPWIKFASLTDPGEGIPFARELFCSMLNTICQHDALGWGVPYGNHIISGEEDNRFADLCLHNVLIFLEVNSWANLYRGMLGDISRHGDFAFLYNNLSRLLESVPRAENTYLPGSQKGIDSFQEVLVLLWKIFDSNKNFIDYVLRHNDVNRILRPICYFLWNGRKRESEIGLVHICTFVVLLLSGERNFGVALNLEVKECPYLAGAPRMSKINHGDLLVVVLHKLIVDGDVRLQSLYNCFFTILSNISPYVKSFGHLASTRLLSLFERFSSRRYLWRAESNHQYVFFMLDLFNNVIQYQFEGNSRLIYTLCLSRDKIKELADMTFSPEISSGAEMAAAADHQFVPTAEWFASWKSKMPIGTLLRTIDILVPQIEALSDGPKDAPIEVLDETKVLHFIKNTTLVGLLPVPHPIVIRRYQPNQYTTLWFTTYTWGVIFLRNQEMPLWDGRKIKLFSINLV
mmetsp:Transcript_22457/g.44111  ORF Transcript_22457/g.44111 Transcript_22457/m.44111 type:complete len:748 (-) Transcript_22457:26-2269(-)